MTSSIQEQIKKELYAQRKNLANCETAFLEEYQRLESMICGSLANGYERLLNESESENHAQSKINKIGKIFNWEFASKIEQHKIQTVLLTDIVELLHIPDFEKERKVYIERGLGFLKKALSDEIFYQDAFRFFSKALTFEDIDYYVLYNLGLIHLFSVRHFDPIKAKSNFEKAAKYGVVDISFTADKYGKHTSSFESLINPKNLSANALLYAARIAFENDTPNKALDLIQRALNVLPNNAEALFDKAIYSLEDGQIELTVQALESAIENDYFIVLKIMTNLKMMQKKEVRDLLVRLNSETRDFVWNSYQKCRERVHEYSHFNEAVNQIQRLLIENTFLATKQAERILAQ